MEIYGDILQMLIPMAMTVCLGGFILLSLRSSGSRSRRLLAFTMLAWGLIYLGRTVGLAFSLFDVADVGAFSPLYLLVGNLYLIVLIPYPLEVIRPGWFTLRRVSLLLLPFLSVTAVYFLGVAFLSQSPADLDSIDDMLDRVDEFNVWFRLVILLSVTGYLVYLFRTIFRYETSYRQWCEENYASTENMEISWLRYYAVGIACIAVPYFWLIFDGGLYCNVVHNVVVQAFFGLALYKGLFHENPYAEKHFVRVLDERQACAGAESCEEPYGLPVVSESESYFRMKLPDYRDAVQTWMEESKPYLRKEFKLMDVAELLPLNRSYLSRVFNEGFGQSFCQVVRGYRLREAERLLTLRTEIPVREVAYRCGFSSPAVFHRVFAESHGGVTPNRYRRENVV